MYQHNISLAASRGEPIPDPTMCRAVLLDREADLLLSHGRHAAAERLSHQASELREVAR
jgi:hypothetical protein